MDVDDTVRSHYARDNLEQTILHALQSAGLDLAALTAEDLGPVDQLHAGGLPATAYLLDRLDLVAGQRLLDVGCGLGGAARLAAARYACTVVGIDLSPTFVGVAQRLTERLGLSALVEHQLAAGAELDQPTASFDRAMMIHVGMNIEDKAAVFAEVRRVLRPGGLFGLFEQLQTGAGALTFPLPWADDDSSSFVDSEATYTELLVSAGFTVELTEDRTAATMRPPDPDARLSPATVFGPPFVERYTNNVAAARAGLLAPIVLVARAV